MLEIKESKLNIFFNRWKEDLTSLMLYTSVKKIIYYSEIEPNKSSNKLKVNGKNFKATLHQH